MVAPPRSILRFWLPLAATWLMMAAEGPFLAAIIARLADPQFNLAAHGVAYALAILIEAPVIMLMSASTALVEDAVSYRRLRTFSFVLSGGVTVVLALLVLPGVMPVVLQGLLGLPEEVSRLTHMALVILIPWPGAIGYRRFYQGLLIRDGRPRLVAWGTVIRLTVMALTALTLYAILAPPGVVVGAAALSAAVTAEAIASRCMARDTVRRLAAVQPGPRGEALGYGTIAQFYYPLALTSLIGLAVQPMLTFLMVRAPSPVESLAVYPVVHALTFVFRAIGLSYQEAAIALMGVRFEQVDALGRFALRLGLGASAALALVAFTPLARVWFETVSGLSPELAGFAVPPTALMVPVPGLAVLLSLQRAILVNGRATAPVTAATLIELAGIALVFALLVGGLGWVGVSAAAAAFAAGRLAANLYLARPCARAVAAVAGSVGAAR